MRIKGLFFWVFIISLAFLFSADVYEKRRERMVKLDIAARGVIDKKVLSAMLKVPRHLLVHQSLRDQAYADYPLPIGEGQTISQPYVVAIMTEALKLKSSDRVLEIGTGSGYQAAVLAEIVREVYSIEIRQKLADRTKEVLKNIGYKNIKCKIQNPRSQIPNPKSKNPEP